MRRRDLLVGLGAGTAGLVAGPGAGHLVGIHEPGVPSVNARLNGVSGVVPGMPSRLGSNRSIWSVRTTAPMAALTFDDGPDPAFTPRVLKALEKAGVHATFPVMGWNSLQHSGLLREIVAQGHEVGNHTWTHQTLSVLTPSQARTEIQHGGSAIEQVTQQPIRFFRPPRGLITGSAVALTAEFGWDLLLWSMTRGPDSGPGSPAEVARYVAETVGPGDIVGLHDGVGRGTFDRDSSFGKGLVARREVEVQALPEILARAADKGLRFVPVSGLLEHEEPGDRTVRPARGS